MKTWAFTLSMAVLGIGSFSLAKEGQDSSRSLDVRLQTRTPLLLASETRLNRCLVCCDRRRESCDRQRGAQACTNLYGACVANCNSSGETPADWACWQASKWHGLGCALIS